MCRFLLVLVLAAATFLVDFATCAAQEPSMPVGMKVIGLKIDAYELQNELIREGTFVDIVGVGKKSSTPAQGSTEIALSDIRVFSKTASSSDNPATTGVIGLLVNEKQAESLILSMKQYGDLQLVPRVREKVAMTSGKVTMNRNATINDLRQMAVQLDDIAARLESLEVFDKADDIRATAQQLRIQARSLPR